MSLSAMSETMSSPSTNKLESLPSFPVKKEQELFPDWLFTVQAVLLGQSLLDVVQKPLPTVQVSSSSLDGNDNVSPSNSTTLSTNFVASESDVSIWKSRAAKAYSLLIRSLHGSSLHLVKFIEQGDAYSVLEKLKSTYGINKSAPSALNMLNKIFETRKLKSESISSYITRIDESLNDMQTLNKLNMEDQLKKTFLLNGLRFDSEWQYTLNYVCSVDTNNQWNYEKLKQYLIDQERNRLNNINTHSQTSSNINDNSSSKAYISNTNSNSNYRPFNNRSSQKL
jgi:hypothetical protein